jgi:CBS domain-containing protein
MSERQEQLPMTSQTLAELQELRAQLETNNYVANAARKRRLEHIGVELRRLQSELENQGEITQATLTSAVHAFREFLAEDEASGDLERVKVFTLMQVHVLTCSREDSLAQASELMWKGDCGSIAVVNPLHELVGIITDRDICMAGYLQHVPLTESQVFTAMARPVFTCSPDDTLADALAMMRKHRVRRLPVVDDHQRLLGMITLGVISRYVQANATKANTDAEQSDVMSTLAAVSEPRDPNGPSSGLH